MLLDFSGVFEELGNKLHVSPDECIKTWARLDDDICRGKLDPQRLFDELALQAGYIGPSVDLISLWIARFQPNTEMHTVVEEISQRYPVGLLTNIYPGVLQRAMAAKMIPILPYAFVVESCTTGFVKPEEEIYKIVEEVSGFGGRDIVFIDDKISYTAPARHKRGWRTYTFDAMRPERSAHSVKHGFGF